MKIGELRIGDELSMGCDALGHEIVWTKVTGLNDFVSKSRVSRKCFDAVEYRNTSRQRRASGNGFFPHSNILAWLNAAGDGWFTPQHEHDEPPSYYRDAGFLTWFSKAERNAIVPREITVAVPLGSRKEFGKTYSLTCKVCLPAISEIVNVEDEHLRSEGAFIPALADAIGDYTMTRTGIGDGAHVALFWLASANKIEKERACESVPVRPMIRLDGSVLIENGGGIYTIVDEEFDKMFMEIISA